MELKIGRSWSEDMVRKATPGRRGPREALMNWGPEKMLIRCSKGSQHPAERTPGLRLSIRRTRKTQRDGHKFGVKIFQLCSVSSSLSHANLEQPFRTLAIKWEVYFSKEVFSRLLFIASVCIQHIYVYFCTNQQMTIKQSPKSTSALSKLNAARKQS